VISGVSEARRKKFGRTPNRSSTRRAKADFGSTGDAELAFVGMIDHASFQASKRLNYKAKLARIEFSEWADSDHLRHSKSAGPRLEMKRRSSTAFSR